MAAAYLGMTADVLFTSVTGRTDILAYAEVTIAGAVGALGSIAIFSALFKGHAPGH